MRRSCYFTAHHRGAIVNMDGTVVSKFPLTSALTDSKGGPSATFTRGASKKHVAAPGESYTTVAINTPTYRTAGGPLGILIEPAITGGIGFNRAINSTGWQPNRASFVGGISAPDGTVNAQKMTSTGTGGTYTFTKPNITIPSGSKRYVSSIVKAGSSIYAEIGVTDGNNQGTNFVYVNFNATTGAVVKQLEFGSFSLFDSGSYALSDGWMLLWVGVNCGSATALRLDYGKWDGANRTGVAIGNHGFDYWKGCTPVLVSPMDYGGTPFTSSRDVLMIPSTVWKYSDYSVYFEYSPQSTPWYSETLFYDKIDANNYISCTYDGTTLTFKIVRAGVTESIVSAVIAMTRSNIYKILLRVPPIGGNISMVVDSTYYTGDAIVQNFLHPSTVYLGGDDTTSSNGIYANCKYINSGTTTHTFAQAG